MGQHHEKDTSQQDGQQRDLCWCQGFRGLSVPLYIEIKGYGEGALQAKDGAGQNTGGPSPAKSSLFEGVPIPLAMRS